MTGIDFPKSPPKCTWAQNASFQTKCSAPVAREPPISLPSHSRFERVCLGPAQSRAKKIAQKPGPPPAQHVAAPGLSELSGFHSTSTIRKSGELEPNSLIARRGVGVGLPTPPDFHSGGPRIFSSTLCTTVWENTRRGAKNPPALHFARIFSGEREMRSGGLRNFCSSTTGDCAADREHFVASILGRPKSSPSPVCGAGGRSQAVGAPSSALDRVHFESADSLALRAQ